MSIDEATTLFDLTERYPETISVLVEAGFRRMTDRRMREQFGSSITIESAALARGMDPVAFLAQLRETITPAPSMDTSLDDGATELPTAHADTPVRIMGLVPCPVRVPMTNVLEAAAESYTSQTGRAVEYNLQAAYVGTEWMEEDLEAGSSATPLPDIFLSAGFRLFFTHERFLMLRRADAFRDRTSWDGVNSFAQSNALADPEGRFAVIGVVPAVFMVNRVLLGSRPVPQSWADILTPEYENSLALPVGDFDLFDALLLWVHRSFGPAGIEQLGRNMFQQMHPAQMVAGASAATDRAQPLVTIMPYFFTKTINETSPLVAVWPADGALAAPILLISRNDRPEIQPLIDEIASLPMSRVLSRLGLFPSTHPENDDFDADSHPLQWPGWDLLLSPELPQLLAETTDLFQRTVNARHQTAAGTHA
jgi:hypothetical protein